MRARLSSPSFEGAIQGTPTCQGPSASSYYQVEEHPYDPVDDDRERDERAQEVFQFAAVLVIFHARRVDAPGQLGQAVSVPALAYVAPVTDRRPQGVRQTPYRLFPPLVMQ